MNLKLIFQWGLIFLLLTGTHATQSPSTTTTTPDTTTPATPATTASTTTTTPATTTSTTASTTGSTTPASTDTASTAKTPSTTTPPTDKSKESGKKSAEDTLQPYCQPALLRSYGLKGLETPENIPLSFCKNVERSCCSYRDELLIYENTILQGSAQKFKSKLENFKTIYNEQIAAMVRVAKNANLIKPTIKYTNNCKILSNSITSYNLDTISAGFKDLHQKYFDFHSKQFEGFGCILCNADSSPYIDLTRKAVQFSAEQCRTTVAASLPFLLYQHVHLRKLSNLMVNFACNCDIEGNYAFQTCNKARLRLQVQKKIKRQLSRCKKNVGKPDWLKSCLGICNNLSLVKFNEFFRPKPQKVQWITQFLNNKMQLFEAQASRGAADNKGAASDSTAVTPDKAATDTSTPTEASKRLRNLRVLRERRRRRLVKKMAKSRKTHYRRTQDVKSEPAAEPQTPEPQTSEPQTSEPQTPIGNSQYYASKILQNLKKAAFESLVIPKSVGAEVDLARFTSIIDKPRPKSSDQGSGSKGGSSGKPSSPAGGLNPQMASSSTVLTPAVFSAAKTAMFKNQTASDAKNPASGDPALIAKSAAMKKGANVSKSASVLQVGFALMVSLLLVHFTRIT